MALSLGELKDEIESAGDGSVSVSGSLDFRSLKAAIENKGGAVSGGLGLQAIQNSISSMVFFNPLLYDNGIDHYGLTEIVRYGSITHYNTYVILEVNDTSLSSAQVALHTDLVDITNFNYLCVEWQGNGRNTLLATSNVDEESQYNAEAGVSELSYFAKKITRLDISALTGDFYLKVAVTQGGYYSTVYKFWLE